MNRHVSDINAEALLVYGKSFLGTLTKKLLCRLHRCINGSPLLCGNSSKSYGMIAVGVSDKYGIDLVKTAAHTDKSIIYRLTGSANIYKKAGSSRPYVD